MCTVEGLVLDLNLDHPASYAGGLPLEARRILEEAMVHHLAPVPRSGTDLYAHAATDVRVLPTGCDSLDALMGGGFREGQLTELAGESASGKTQILFQVMVICSEVARGPSTLVKPQSPCTCSLLL